MLRIAAVKLSPFAFDRDRELLRFAFPISVFLVYAILWNLYVPHLFDGPAVTSPNWSAIAGREAMARLGVAGALVILWTIAVAAIGYSVVLIRNRRAAGDKSGAWAIRIAIGGTLLLILLTLLGIGMGGDLYTLLGQSMFEATVGRIGGDASATTSGGLFLLRVAVGVSNIAVVGAGLFVLMANCRIGSTFRPLPKVPPGAQLTTFANDEAPLVARAIADQRSLLFVGAALLVSGMLVAKAWREWPLAFCETTRVGTADVCAPGPFATFGQKVTASVLFDATSFVVILVAIFVPKALMLRKRADDLATAAGFQFGTPTFSAWQTNAGLAWPWNDQIVKLLALLAPLIGTAAASLFESLIPAFRP
jgi:hypothetical protein